MEIQSLIKILYRYRFSLSDEKILQNQIAQALEKNCIIFEREVLLGSKSRIDFMLGGIGIEVKLKGSRVAIFKQCKRYCEFDRVKRLILVTNRSQGFPESINDKPCYVVELGRAWL